MNELALFAGGGGGLLASRLLGWRTVCYVEREPYCVEVIKARIRDGWLDDAPIWDDVTTFDGEPWAGYVDVVSGGFPCQPYSNAGKRAGADDSRNLWPDTLRVIRAVRPEWCLLENVAALTTYDYFQAILGSLAESGFDIAWDCISASSVGAPHLRERLWIVAHAHNHEKWRRTCAEQMGRLRGTKENAPNRKNRRIKWGTEPNIPRVAHGVAYRVDRLNAIGNGQVPLVAATAWRLLSERLRT